jgi:CHAT domain-containing protein
LGSDPDDFRKSVGYQLSYSSPIVTGRLHDLDNDIASIQNGMLFSRRSDPLRTIHLQRLSKARLERYTLSNQQDDLEQSILSLTEAIYIPLPFDARLSDLNVVLNFNLLTHVMFLRAKNSGQPEDIRCCVIYLRYMRGQWHGPDNFPLPITTTLVSALALKVALKFGDVDQDIEEIADLCNELLSSNISKESLTEVIADFAGAAPAHIKGLNDGKSPSSRVVNSLRKATMRLPELHDVSFYLAMALLKCCYINPSDADYKEGMAILDKLISFRGPGDSPSPYREEALNFAAMFATTHFYASGKPEYLEQAIYRIRTWSDDETSFEDPLREFILEQLSNLEGMRQNDSNIKAGFQNTQFSTSDSDKLQSFRDLTASLPELDPAEPLSWTTIMRHRNVFERDSYDYITDTADIEDGVKYCRQLLDSSSGDILAQIAQRALRRLFCRAFECTNKIEYLNKAISATRDEIDIAFTLVNRMQSRLSLISLLSTRINLLRRREDLDELMQLFPIVANSEHADFLYLVPISCIWALTAHRFGHHSTATAYDHAMSSMQASLTLAPTLDIQHSRLVANSHILATLPLDCASYQIHTSRLKQAIEALERGRALLWSEMRGLRTSIDQIRLANPDVAEKLMMVNRTLETLTLAFLPNNNVGVFRDSEGLDPFGHLVLRQRKLLDDRKKLISQVQSLTGFDTFLRPPAFDTLCSAASRGPVVIINHSRWRCDIVILLRNSPPSLISTADDFYTRAINLQNQLLGKRKNGLESNTYEDSLRSVLKELFELVGRPVIKRLNELNVPEQSRVWWCPTSVFCSLPLHAMGPISSDVGPRYFLDLYIPSYIPSLSSLIESRKPGSQVNGKPSILLVAQPDEKMPQALKEMKAIQAIDTKVTTLFSAKATPTAVLGRLQDHRFAHIVCHGILEPGKPFEASFKLHRGKRLLLIDIVRSQLDNAEFAFLSACHTAELTEESIADEVLHLAAAMQFCGFRSVVGTMWAMADIDGRDLAEFFYESVFSDEWQGVHYYERTAQALRDAVMKLRRKKANISLERWVNFVHYGA